MNWPNAKLLTMLLDLIPRSMHCFALKEHRADRHSPRVLKPRTHLLTDSSPRSANTYSNYYLQLALPNALVAHHIHTRQQFLFVQTYGVYSQLLRDSGSAVSSLVTKFLISSSAAYLRYAIIYFPAARLNLRPIEITEASNLGELSRTATEISPALRMPPQSVVDEDTRSLLETHTNKNNRKATPLDLTELSGLAQACRRVALVAYNAGITKRVEGACR